MNIFLNNLFCLARPFLANTEEVDLHGSIIQTASNISTDSSINKTLELDYYEVIIEPNYYLNYLLSNAVKMCSDSQRLSSIPSNLLVYVLKIVKM